MGSCDLCRMVDAGVEGWESGLGGGSRGEEGYMMMTGSWI